MYTITQQKATKKKIKTMFPISNKKEMELKQSLINTRNAIRKKYKDLHGEKLDIREKISETYKPIIDPIKSLIKTKNVKTEKTHIATPPPTSYKIETVPDSVFKTANPAFRRNLFAAKPQSSSSYQLPHSSQHDISGISDLNTSVNVDATASTSTAPDITAVTPSISDDQSNEIEQIEENLKIISSAAQDNNYGFRSFHGNLYMGKDPVYVKTVNKEILYSIKKQHWPVTHGLTNLLLSNNPKYYTEKELDLYKEMILATNVHKHRSARKKFPRRSYVMRGINDTFQADLIEMQPWSNQNRGYRYILMVIDVFSKRAWAIPLKNKTGPEVTQAMATIFKTNPQHIPRNMHTDQGKEFYNAQFQQLMRTHEINHYSTYSTLKASIVERLNRTILNRLWRLFSLQGSHKWLNNLQSIMDSYNETKHRTIKMRPIDVNAQNESLLLRTVYQKNQTLANKAKNKPKFKVNDNVRVSKYKSLFEKGYTPNWSTEIFKIVKVSPTEPITYHIVDLDGDRIKGGFYESELQKTNLTDVYLVEKIIRRKGNKVFVKWLGFDDKHSSWINADDVI